MSSSPLDHPILSARYFFPRDDRPPEVFPVEVGGDGCRATLACVLHRTPGAEQGVIVFHGNGEVVADYVPDFVDALGSLGLDVLLAEYRGYGGSTGTPSLRAMLDDVTPLVAALGLAPERITAFGRSIGSVYALECARRFPSLGGLIIESGIADPLERVLLRVTPDELGISEAALLEAVAAHFDHKAKIETYAGPVLVMHARHDSMVHVSHGERSHAWATAASWKKLLVLPQGDHNSIQLANHDAYWQALRDFFAR